MLYLNTVPTINSCLRLYAENGDKPLVIKVLGEIFFNQVKIGYVILAISYAAPTDSYVDTWFDMSTRKIKRRNGSSWVELANKFVSIVDATVNYFNYPVATNLSGGTISGGTIGSTQPVSVNGTVVNIVSSTYTIVANNILAEREVIYADSIATAFIDTLTELKNLQITQTTLNTAYYVASLNSLFVYVATNVMPLVANIVETSNMASGVWLNISTDLSPAGA